MAQGVRIEWEDGETQDIVGVVNERLATSQAEHAAWSVEQQSA